MPFFINKSQGTYILSRPKYIHPEGILRNTQEPPTSNKRLTQSSQTWHQQEELHDQIQAPRGPKTTPRNREPCTTKNKWYSSHEDSAATKGYTVQTRKVDG